ncbi:MAG: TetR/AcrR family transcriptional regulator [Pseudomonadota bacterium]
MPRKQSTNEQMRDQRRAQILSASLQLFASRGLAATRICDIAEAVPMAQGLVYHYFSCKEEIFTALIRHAFERLNAACQELEALQAPARDKVDMALRALLQGFAEGEDAARAHMLIAQATASTAIPDEARAILARDSALPYEVMARILAQGQREGTIREADVQQLALVFWTTIKGLAMHRAAHGQAAVMPEAEILMALFDAPLSTQGAARGA